MSNVRLEVLHRGCYDLFAAVAPTVSERSELPTARTARAAHGTHVDARLARSHVAGNLVIVAPMSLGRLISRPQPCMSPTAKRFLMICSFIERELNNPHKTGQADFDLFVNCCRRRELAADLIGYGCEPVLAEGLTPNFCQAGVVAPPDSLMDEKTAADEEAFHEERLIESQLMSEGR